MCLYLIDNDEPIQKHGTEVYSSARACGAGPEAAPGWWTVSVPLRHAEAIGSQAHEHTYKILCVCLTMQIPQAWKIIQLSLLTLWNVAARQPAVERHIVSQGVAIALMDLATAPVWPHSLRFMAAGLLAVVHDGGYDEAHTGGLVPLCSTYIVLLRSGVCTPLFVVLVALEIRHLITLLFVQNA
jgi:hypothetical protein